jgi:hypothetical protein
VAADDATTARLRVEARSGHRPERERHSAPEQHSAAAQHSAQQERREEAELSDPARHALKAAAACLPGEAKEVEVRPAV